MEMMIMSSTLTATQVSALSAVRTVKVYVDNAGRLYIDGGLKISTQTFRSLLSRGVARVNGASRVRLDNGRTGRRVVLTIAGRSALGV
jgi:hypothetical protein